MKKILLLLLLMMTCFICGCNQKEKVEYSDKPINQVVYVAGSNVYFSVDLKGKRYKVNLTEYDHYTDGKHWRVDVEPFVESKDDKVIFKSDIVMARMNYVRGSENHMVGAFYIYFTEYNELHLINVLVENEIFDKIELIEEEFENLPDSTPLLNYIKRLVNWGGE